MPSCFNTLRNALKTFKHAMSKIPFKSNLIGFKNYCAAWFKILFLIFLTYVGQARAQQPFRMAELNCENFFDCLHDEGKEDTPFLPDGPRRWTPRRYWKKVNNIGKLLMSMYSDRPVDVIALTEVENDSVMTDLCRKSILRRMGYDYRITDSPDRRGIDVALMFLPETFRPLADTTLCVSSPEMPDLKTRDILYVAGRLVNGDTLHLYVVHLSSRLRGKRSEKYRRQECRTLMNHVKGIQKRHPNAHIAILGDFNDTPTSKTLTQYLNAEPDDGNHLTVETQKLYNLSYRQQADRGIRGTYKYDGRWEMIDQCLVSGSLLQDASLTQTRHGNLHLWAPDFILEEDKEDRGLKPRRTYNGYRYNGGYSDHLPFYIDFMLNFRPEDRP